MTNEQILERAIDKAVKNGWKKPDDYIQNVVMDINYDLLKDYARHGVIFSHDFAKAFWGERLIESSISGNEGWQYHLQQMVISKDPIKYLEQFI